MESDQRYYSRRAAEELSAARRAITPAAELRHRQLAENYTHKLRELGVAIRPLAAATAVAGGRSPTARTKLVSASVE